MPRVPLFDSHGKGVNIFVKEFEQTDRLDDRFVLSVDIQGDLVSGEGVSKTQSGLLEFDVLELFVFEEIQEVLPNATDKLIDHSRSCGLDLQSLVQRTS